MVRGWCCSMDSARRGRPRAAQRISGRAGGHSVSLPEAPIQIPMGFGDSRAWWMIDMARIQADRAAGKVRDMSGEIPRDYPSACPHEGVLDEIRTTLGADPARTVLGGFSQGAMLSCDALLHSMQPYAGLIQLSGTLVAKQEWAPLLTKRKDCPLSKPWHAGSHSAVQYGRAVA